MREKQAFDRDEQDRIEKREERFSTLLSPAEQEATRRAMNLSDYKQEREESALPQAKGYPAPQITLSVTQDIPSPKIELLTWHSDTMETATKLGELYDRLPILEVDVEDAEDTVQAILEPIEDVLKAYDDTVVVPMLSELMVEEKHRVQDTIMSRKGTIVAANGDVYLVCFDELKGDLRLDGTYDNGMRNIPARLLQNLKGEPIYVG